jgi:hypothetical protein
VENFFALRRVCVVPHEVIPKAVEPTWAAVARAPLVEEEYQYEGEKAEGELNLAADPALREIYESDPRPIRVAHVELVEVFVASVRSMFRSNRLCLLYLSLSTTAETELRQQLAERKVDYRD